MRGTKVSIGGVDWFAFVDRTISDDEQWTIAVKRGRGLTSYHYDWLLVAKEHVSGYKTTLVKAIKKALTKRHQMGTCWLEPKAGTYRWL